MDYMQVVAAVRESFADLAAWLTVQRPRLLGAAALLAAGWLLAKLARTTATRLLRALGRIVPSRMLQRGLPPVTLERHISDVVGLIVFWAVLLFFVAAAADTLGLPVLSTSLAGLGLWAPRLLGALLVAVFGLVIGNLARDAIVAAAAAAGTPFAAAMGQIARAAILVATGLIAVGEIGIDITLLTVILAVIVAAVLGAFALAFGLGARTAVSNIIGAHYLRQQFAPGQHVRLGDVEGIITAITATAVVLRVPDGDIVIPARHFNETTSMLVTGGRR